MKTLLLTRFDKLKLTGLCIKAASGIVGGSLILSEAKPYLTLAILAVGGIANEVVSFLKDKENSRNNDDSKSE